MTVDTAVYIALIAAVSAIGSPVLMAWMTERNRSKGKAEDYARQDEVAARADRAAEAIRVGMERTANRLVESDARSAEIAKEYAATAKEQGAVIAQIHVLVNSNLTMEMQKGLAAHKALLALLLRLAPEDIDAIAGTEKSIRELELQIGSREDQTRMADAVKKRAEKPS